ncbi:Phosphoenolpyruvate carboxykinase isoform 1 [Actinidia chinensis var. chinensis]|uniref:Phosphoenolpyruvate carboxykinase isoform 1 n=1 Tax=Actinidia chinensis var. chinensis TaxID=1590841 RepID=A0A2R6RIR4_ACTCC|nr:Phosphoenolpyruvate carboxykinase isoform 1 [Actinidia chinensis var. chinensis]
MVAIESAHDKIIMRKFHEKKNPKIDIKKKVRAVTESHIAQVVLSRFRTPPTNFIIKTRFRTPPTNFIIKTSVAFLVLGALTILFPTEEVQHFRAGDFVFSWLFGTFLIVSVIPPILEGPRSLEITTSLIT